MESLNDRIKLIFKDSGLTQMDISKRLNIAQSSVSGIISGKANPSKRTLADIADRFDVNLEWLRDGTGQMKKEHPLKHDLGEFFAEVISTDVPYRDEFILALSELAQEHWKILGDLILRTAERIKEKAEEGEAGE